MGRPEKQKQIPRYARDDNEDDREILRCAQNDNTGKSRFPVGRQRRTPRNDISQPLTLLPFQKKKEGFFVATLLRMTGYLSE
jgi:hypothetical protein